MGKGQSRDNPGTAAAAPENAKAALKGGLVAVFYIL
jgi:hypothetical protein